MSTFFQKFSLKDQREDYPAVVENIHQNAEFKGFSLWILIFAIFIASLGLNVNSTAVVIGAMLVSPLMGPIMGLGFGMAVNDLSLMKKAFNAYVFAAIVGLATSTVYFLISPINSAHSEILARTSPNFYDVFIALFGGLAGIFAVSGKMKGNVIPGVAIATALLPPLCTAGYGLATWQLQFFFGAFYLFMINSVFISLATLITARILQFPFKKHPKEEDEIRAKRIVYFVVAVTLFPSIYFGYDMIQQTRYIEQAQLFIEREAVFPNDYLLKKQIDPENKKISLTFGGELITNEKIEQLKSRMEKYALGNTQLEVRQGFAYLQATNGDEEKNQLSFALAEKEDQIRHLSYSLDSLKANHKLSWQIFKELKVQYEQIHSFAMHKTNYYMDTTSQETWLTVIGSTGSLDTLKQKKIREWLQIRTGDDNIFVFYQDVKK